MRLSSFCFVFFLVGAALTFLGLSSTDGVNFAGTGISATRATSRKLKEDGHNPRTYGNGNTGKANLEDYGPIDPAPNSKGSIRPRPIDHGTPLIPFIPKPSPPSPIKVGE
ncbi:uncharacterized protein LOC115675921 [Syzygium oleosum]|uniref:uncharacterized protein LOC115675921 n=1 Tax=Syzygium oleosum TaxID=219896 RepID=UPI0024B9770E|nr:uncharacterized protein LOC115675921 [Syzygium oleosum]XP_056173109.1 uncharacterized protein LOC115675921 [Syzygium oleosum]